MDAAAVPFRAARALINFHVAQGPWPRMEWARQAHVRRNRPDSNVRFHFAGRDLDLTGLISQKVVSRESNCPSTEADDW